MSRRERERCALSLLIVGLACLAGCRQETSGSDPPRHFVLITIDTLRADHVGCYGYPRDTTPNIDRLAQTGTLFEHAEVQWPKTGPSMASMLTSTYPLTNRVQMLRSVLDGRFATIAEMLRDQGFYTASFVANVHLGKAFGLDQGFQECHELWRNTDRTLDSNTQAMFYTNTEIADRVMAWLRDTAPKQKRFFLWVHLLDPHGPYKPPSDVLGRYDNDPIYQKQLDVVPQYRLPAYQRNDWFTMAEFIARYDEEAHDSDRAVGRILDQLAALKLDRKSLVVLTADHGESLGEHDYWMSHGMYVYETCARVPLVVSCPGRVPVGKRIDAAVPLLDLVPTVLDYLDVGIDAYSGQLQGRSIRPLLDDQELDPGPIVTQGPVGQLACRIGRMKYVFDPRPSTPDMPVLAQHQLYDVLADPLETNNLWDAQGAVWGPQMQSALQAWQSAAVAKTREILGSDVETTAPQLDPTMKNWLEQMGYVHEDEATGSAPATQGSRAPNAQQPSTSRPTGAPGAP